MSFSTGSLARRSAGHYWKHHLVTFLAVALCSAVLTGALMVGQAMRGSLAKRNLERTGNVRSAMHTGDRFFRTALAAQSGAVAGVLLHGSVASGNRKVRVHNVQILAVPNEFWALGAKTDTPELDPDHFFINQRLAERLGAKLGDSILLRASNPSALPREAVFSADDDTTVTLPGDLGGIVSGEAFGNFALEANPLPPYTVFVSMEHEILKRIDRVGQANLLLSSDPLDLSGMTLEDVELELNNKGILKSERIFLDDAVIQMAEDSGVGHEPVLTYFVNEFRIGDRSVPYSMVTATEDIVNVPDGKIVLDDWVAAEEDLAAKPGETLEMVYYTLGEARRLITVTNSFTVDRVIEKTGTPAEDDSLTTEFPGFEGKENCRDWDPNLPVDIEKIRDRDEEYWDAYGPSPKAFVSLGDGQKMWENAYGSLTSIRFDAVDGLREKLAAHLDPAAFGFIPRDLQAEGKAASKGTMDFGGLFLAMSWFLILAAILLALLQIGFGLDYRAEELELYRTLGLGAKKARGLVLRELLWVIVLGALLGGLLGYLYLALVLRGLNGAWSGAGAKGLLQATGKEWMMIGIGALSVILLMLAAIWRSVNKRVKRPGRRIKISPKKRGLLSLIGFVWFGLSAIGLFFYKPSDPAMLPGVYSTVGTCSLLAGICLVAWLLRGGGASNLVGLARRNLSRRMGRTLAVVAMLAAGTYMVFSTGIFKRGEDSAGTGRFALIANTTQPVYRDLNLASAREALSLDDEVFDAGDVSFTPVRVSRGEEASCLNLQAAQQPLVVGIDPVAFADRFEIVAGEGWDTLGADADEEGVVPAIGDLNALQWAMHKKVGDVVRVGQGRVKIVGAVNYTILQGRLLVDNRHFKTLFPDQGGYRQLLIDAPDDKAEEVSGAVTSALRDLGAEVVPARARLAELNAVQNAYIDIFQTLGGLGVLLGCLGLGILCIRSLLERRKELAVMQAVGFSRSRLTKMLLVEQGGLLLVGLLVGAVAGLLAAVPVARAMGVGAVPGFLFVVLVAGALLGLGSILFAARIFLRQPVTQNLRAD